MNMKIVTAGDNCIDYYIDLNKGFPGGNPVNVAVYSKRYTDLVGYIGFVGNDENGRILTTALIDKGVDVSRVHTIPGRTAVTKVRLIDNDRVFCGYDEGVHEFFSLSEEDFEYISRSEMFVSGIWGKCEDFVPEIKKRGIPIAFDFADKLDSPIIDSCAGLVDYAFFSWPYEKKEDMVLGFMKKLKEKGYTNIIVTLGSAGSIAFDGSNVYKYGIIPCDVVDTMGAGDSFIAGFLCAVIAGKSIDEAMAQGTQSSTITIQYKGAW